MVLTTLSTVLCIPARWPSGILSALKLSRVLNLIEQQTGCGRGWTLREKTLQPPVQSRRRNIMGTSLLICPTTSVRPKFQQLGFGVNCESPRASRNITLLKSAKWQPVGLSGSLVLQKRRHCINFPFYGDSSKLSTLRRGGSLLDFRCAAEAGRDLQSALKFSKKVQTDSLPPAVRDSTMKAIDELGLRVTNGDVASKAGLKVSQAESALQALAADSDGYLEVSDEGDVLYAFPKDYRSRLASKSLRLKAEPVLNKLQAAGGYLIRVSFGTALLASIVIVYSTILVLLSSGRSEEDNRGNRGGFGNQRYSSGVQFYVSPADLFWFWDPYYYRRPRTKSKGGMNFFESVFSFVFGDGDPNEGLEERRWKTIGDLIASKGGVVTAEELAPFLEVPPVSEETKKDEAFVLPVLLRFDGYPEVDRKGNILYRFPSLQRTANDWIGQRKESSEDTFYLSEKRWKFSKASKMEQALVIGLGAVNLLGVVVLGSMLRDLNLVGQLSGTGLIPFASRLLPWLQGYTAAFFAIPAFRWLLLQKRNTEIEDRNRARIGWAVALQRANKALQDKLSSAREMAQRTFIGSDRIIYSTEKDLSEQSYDAREWDRQFKERQRGKG
ncbi:hypothetical protein R1flu_018070 [Riccia fluitans]|uniref:Iron-sulfur cluster biosynthesis family protein n=1 Tax=Riccia fluitans TaxID=41844 RepID=A0ABD1ZFU0_9MARC